MLALRWRRRANRGRRTSAAHGRDRQAADDGYGVRVGVRETREGDTWLGAIAPRFRPSPKTMTERPLTWDPHEPGRVVRLRDNPGRQGMTTGRTRQAGTFLMVEVYFGPTEKVYKHCTLLEPVEVQESVLDILSSGRFGVPMDLRRTLTFEKVKGELTNVFYSMESSNTLFYPHQFKAVLKFIESPVGRLLIADEVGLGKTIESIYIWKELQARQDARRLLIVCPAMLREKWREDLANRFSIAGEIITSKPLLQKMSDFVRRGLNDTFVYITSLEGLRPPSDFEDHERQETRTRFARLLDQNTDTANRPLFDLVIIDEAHHLRNPATANNRLGRLLRDSAVHMVLLTATPIQISSDNLYQILRLIDPDQFYDVSVFGEMLRANQPLIRALRALWHQPPDVAIAADAVSKARKNPYFANDRLLRLVGEQLPSIASDPLQRIEAVRLLESRSLLGQYMTRSRKREVLEDTVQRSAQVLRVRFSAIERRIYDRVTHNIRVQSVGRDRVSQFTLIARQRQMSSSLVAAIASWESTGVSDDLLWEDLGHASALDEEFLDGIDAERVGDSTDPLGSVGSLDVGDSGIGDIDIRTLEASDGKYEALLTFLRGQRESNPDEKFVVFAFFRGTLTYLARRLKQDGVPAVLIMGGMGEAKNTALRQFRDPAGPSVLLSSEVGSEGIDLEHCRFVVNYDLPWNPMRVEQRIGRLDRLGQTADKISVVSIAVTDTIEDRVLLRLYERIQLFEQSIGDLESILGEATERLMLELLDPKLTDEERDLRAKRTEDAIHRRRLMQDRLEREAVNLTGFSDYILAHIHESRERRRWLSAEELMALVGDFLDAKYPGTKLQNDPVLPSAIRIRLSRDAKSELKMFMMTARPATGTRLHQSRTPIVCLFDPRATGVAVRGEHEIIEPTHPLIQWIRHEYTSDDDQLYPVAAVRLDLSRSPVGIGDYVFIVHRWSFTGLRSDHVLMYSAIRLRECEPLSATQSEELVVAAAASGRAFPNAVHLLGNGGGVSDGAAVCDGDLAESFRRRTERFVADNEHRCNQQETSARRFYDRRIAELKERIARFRAQGGSRAIPMTEGLLRKEERQLDEKLSRIEVRREVDPEFKQLAAGVVRVEVGRAAAETALLPKAPRSVWELIGRSDKGESANG